MNIEYVNHLPEGLQRSAARLYLNALQDKLTPIFGSDERGEQLLMNNLRADNCIAAICNGALAGILGIQTVDGGFLDPTFEMMVDAYGIFSGIFRVGAMAVLHHETAADEIYVDGIAVVETMRGKGIGSHLLNLLEKRALAEHIRTISLEVINTNPRAEALYQRQGFVPVKHRTLWPFNWLMKFPFNSATLMKKTLDPGAGPNDGSAI